MTETRFPHSQRSAASPPPAPGRTRLEINWNESVVQTILIRHGYFKWFEKVSLLRFKRHCESARDIQFARDAAGQKCCISRSGRRTS